MNTYRIRRGTPCDVRRLGDRDWRAHVCSNDSEVRDQTSYAQTEHWVFLAQGWEIRVRVRFLEVVTRAGDEQHFGVTGTREGLTPKQRAAVRDHLACWLKCALPTESPVFHHGGCVGADRHVHNVIREVWGRVARIVIHPASDQPESLCDWSDAD